MHLATEAPVDHAWRRIGRSGRIVVGGGVLALVMLTCIATLPLTARDVSAWNYDLQSQQLSRLPPTRDAAPGWFGYDPLGLSMLSRCLMGGAMSLAIGLAAAALAVTMGVSVGLLAGYRGGWVDNLLMRIV